MVVAVPEECNTVWKDSLEVPEAVAVVVKASAAGHRGSRKGMFRTLFQHLLPEAPMFGPTSVER